MGRPDRRRLFHVQYRLNPARCQPTTVSGRTSCSDCRHLVHNLDRQAQKIRSNSVSRGRGSRAFHTASCCRSARFSSANSRCVRRELLSVPKRIPSHRTMTGEIADQSAECKLIAADDFLEGTGCGTSKSVRSAAPLCNRVRPTSATGTGWERAAWHATQRAAWETLLHTQKGTAP